MILERTFTITTFMSFLQSQIFILHFIYLVLNQKPKLCIKTFFLQMSEMVETTKATSEDDKAPSVPSEEASAGAGEQGPGQDRINEKSTALQTAKLKTL